MSEPGYLDFSAPAGVQEVVSDAERTVRAVISAATEAATAISRRRAERDRQAAARNEESRRQARERQQALYEADRLVWQRVWDDRFWERATPARIGRAWEACVPWAAEGFPAAHATVEHMRAEIRERYGVDVDPVQTRAGDLARLLATPTTDSTQEQADPPAETSEASKAPAHEQLTTISYRIRDLHNDGAVIATNTVHLGRGEGPHTAMLIAAQALTGQSAPGLVVDVVAGADPHAATVLGSLDQDAARAALQAQRDAVAAGRAGDVDACRSDEAAERVAEALRFEQRRLRSLLRTPDAGEDAENVEDLRAQIADAGLRLRAIEADRRGEDGDLVIRAAALRTELDEQWWAEATPEQITAMWKDVSAWSPGAGRDQALYHLQAGLHRHHGLQIEPAASADTVAKALADQAANQASRQAPGRNAGTTWAQDQASAAAQNENARPVYEEMRQSEPVEAEAADAADTVAKAHPAGPSARLNRTARQERRGGGSRMDGPARTPQRSPRQVDSPSR